MRYDGVYKTYKLYSITEQDAAETGGTGESRYINNTVLVFLPDIEKPEIGTELFATDTMTAAKELIDENDKKPIKDVMDAAILKSQEQEQQRTGQHHAITQEDERRRKERRDEEYLQEQEK